MSGSFSQPSTSSAMRSASASLRTRRVSLRNFSDHVVLARELLLAAARRLDGLGLARAVGEMHLDAHHVAQLGAARGDGGVVDHLDLGGERHAAGIGDDGVGELVDEHVAFGEQRRDAERQVHLRRGEALRPVRPADVIDGRLRAVHHDLRDLVGAGTGGAPRWCGWRRGWCGCCRRRNRI